jgi:hypothetical protein
LYFVAIVTGLVVGTLVWVVGSHWIANSITWAETNQPHLFGSRRLRAGEALACGLLFLACLAIAFWIAWAMIR